MSPASLPKFQVGNCDKFDIALQWVLGNKPAKCEEVWMDDSLDMSQILFSLLILCIMDETEASNSTKPTCTLSPSQYPFVSSAPVLRNMTVHVNQSLKKDHMKNYHYYRAASHDGHFPSLYLSLNPFMFLFHLQLRGFWGGDQSHPLPSLIMQKAFKRGKAKWREV